MVIVSKYQLIESPERGSAVSFELQDGFRKPHGSHTGWAKRAKRKAQAPSLFCHPAAHRPYVHDDSSGDRAQTQEYVGQHLTYAGVEREIFSDGALNEIFQFSSGVARLINKLCTHCLMYGVENHYRIIDDHMVKRVIQGELS